MPSQINNTGCPKNEAIEREKEKRRHPPFGITGRKRGARSGHLSRDTLHPSLSLSLFVFLEGSGYCARILMAARERERDSNDSFVVFNGSRAEKSCRTLRTWRRRCRGGWWETEEDDRGMGRLVSHGLHPHGERPLLPTNHRVT